MSKEAAPTLLSAKLAPPPALDAPYRASTVDALCEACGPGKVLIVQAPAGFGKTALLAALHERLGDAAWVTIDAVDSCWTLRQYARAALGGLGENGTLIVTGLGAMPAAQEALDCLLGMCGPGQTLVVSSSAHVECADAVRFGQDELRLEPADLAPLCMSPEQADEIWVLACGWPEVSTLLARTTPRPGDGSGISPETIDAIAAFSEEEVISRLSAEDDMLLGRLALLPTADPHIVGELTGAMPDALERLAEETPFFAREADGTYRLAPILQIAARRHRTRVGALPDKEFLLEASSAYARRGQPFFAAWCAVIAGSYRRAAVHLFEAAGEEAAPGSSSLEALEHVIALADRVGPGSGSDALRASAGEVDLAEVRDMLERLRGRAVASNSLDAMLARIDAFAEAQADAVDNGVGQDAAQAAADPGLTPAELNVMRLLASGMNARQIAEATNTSEATVRTHTKRAYRKLDAHGKKQAVQKAMALGLV